MRNPLQYRGSIAPYGTTIKQYTYKNLSVCVSYDDEAMEDSEPLTSIKNILHISFDSRNYGVKNKNDMLYCAQQLGIDTSKPFKEYDILSANPLTTQRYIHYYEQAV